MFDIREYYRDVDPRAGLPVEQSTGEIEEDLSIDIDNLLRARFDPLYVRDRFRRNSATVEIIYPRRTCHGSRAILRGPDYMRYLLSLYPRKSDLENVEKIVLRPRHIEEGETELMALYLRQRAILVFYLHHPCLFAIDNSRFGEYAEFLSFEIAESFASGGLPAEWSTRDGIRIPPLWYVLSIVSRSDDTRIDKFFIRRDRSEAPGISSQIDEISFFYSRNGY
ncbi:MAG TPA: hypothetical protein VLM75_10365 [Spirochaetota bacterium]|nr:hypothetical protein [Spirochaetota bacterium]